MLSARLGSTSLIHFCKRVSRRERWGFNWDLLPCKYCAVSKR